MTRVVVCCGMGGVGKTTTAAALGLGLAMQGQRVAVLTIDPARRLADALGVGLLGNRPGQVDLATLGYGGPGTLHALMLDRKATWDEVIRRFSPTGEAADRLLANRYYQAVSTRLTGSHEYMATEKLYDLVSAELWDVVVIDTPPAQQTVEFFRAPERVRRVFDQRVLDVLIHPGKGLVSRATQRLVDLTRHLAGESVMRDISEFFTLMSGLSSGFRERHQAVHELLHSARTGFYLVASARNPQRQDTLDFLVELSRRGMTFHGFLVNRTTVAPGLSLPLASSALPSPPEQVSEEAWDEALTALLDLAECRQGMHRRERHDMAELVRAAGGEPGVWPVPELPGGVHSLEGLARVATHLPPASQPVEVALDPEVLDVPLPCEQPAG